MPTCPFDLRSIEGFGPILCARVAHEFPYNEWLDAPYALARVAGVGFKRADAVAAALGIAKDSPERINAAAWYGLGEFERDGHTAMPTQEFGKMLFEALNIKLPNLIDFDDSIYEENGLISRRSTTKAERLVARQMRLMQERPAQGIIGQGRLASSMKGLAQDQMLALAAIDSANVFALMGGPGVGKTYLVRRIAESESSTQLCAPTGKGAKRIEELSGRPAQTIHRLLGVIHPQSSEYERHPPAHSSKFRFRHNRRHPLDADLVIVDESSMVDIKLMADLCEALSYDARLILVGDPFQLPSVGPGAVLRDLTACASDGNGGPIPNVELTELKRQGPSLLIARNCKSIRFEKRAIVDNHAAQDFFFLPSENPLETQRAVVEFATKRLPEKYGLDASEIMVLAPLREKGELSVKALNLALRSRLNPEAVNYSMPWTGDRVIQRSNDYDLEIYNGDCGTVVEATPATLRILFDTPARELEGRRDEFDLDLAFALTVHKSQGSEWAAVIVVIDPSGPAQYLADAQLTYTAISRAREVCVCIGSRRALDAQVARHRAVNRWTRLGAMMRE